MTNQPRPFIVIDSRTGKEADEYEIALLPDGYLLPCEDRGGRE